MRKSIITTLLLLVLCVSGMVAAHGAVNDGKDAVTFEETVLYGDRSAADDLIVDLFSVCNGHLFWNTMYDMGNPTAPQTDFHFSETSKYLYDSNRAQTDYDQMQPYASVYMELAVDFGISSTPGFNIAERSDPFFLCMMDLLLDIDSRAPVNATHTETVFLADYYEYYPMTVTLNLQPRKQTFFQGTDPTQVDSPESPYGLSSEVELSRALAEYFPIPVRETDQVEVTIVKDRQAIIEMNCNTLFEGTPAAQTYSVVTDDVCYFTFDARDTDVSQVDLGYGIYRLPFTTDVNVCYVDPADLRMVYPLDPQTQIEALVSAADGRELLLMTREPDGFYLTVIDAQTMQDQQMLKLIEYPEQIYTQDPFDDEALYLNAPFFYEDFIVVFSTEQRFSVIERTESGSYARVFTTDMQAANQFDVPLSHSSSLFWDGERLVMTQFHNSDNYFATCSYYLWVYDQSGLLYMGEYESSLDSFDPLAYQDNVRPSQLHVRFAS